MEMKLIFQELLDQDVLYLLALLCLAMFLDMVSGMIAAKVTHEFTSKIGINGILRKVSSLLLLLFFLPVSLLIPLKAGIGLLYTFYLSYLFMEIHSILENYQKMGIDAKWYQDFFKTIQEYLKKHR